jgi:anti-anti-sigma regulatory factor
MNEDMALPHVADVTEVRAHWNTWQVCFNASSVTVCDASSVERMTTPFVQLMLAAHRAAGLAGGRFLLEQPSEAVQEAFHALGLVPSLQEMNRHD